MFQPFRREKVGGTFLTMAVVGIGTGFSSVWFKNFPDNTKLVMYSLIVVFFVIGWVMMPPKPPRGGS